MPPGTLPVPYSGSCETNLRPTGHVMVYLRETRGLKDFLRSVDMTRSFLHMLQHQNPPAIVEELNISVIGTTSLTSWTSSRTSRNTVLANRRPDNDDVIVLMSAHGTIVEMRHSLLLSEHTLLRTTKTRAKRQLRSLLECPNRRRSSTTSAFEVLQLVLLNRQWCFIP